MSVHFENQTVSITLPVGWTDQSDNDVLAFTNLSTHEELTIGFGQIAQCVDPAQLPDFLWRFIQSKVRAVAQLASGSFTVLDAVQPTPSIPSVGTFSGLDTKNSVYSRVSVTGHIGHFVSVTYYLHKCKAASAETEARARVVIDMCRVKALAAPSTASDTIN